MNNSLKLYDSVLDEFVFILDSHIVSNNFGNFGYRILANEGKNIQTKESFDILCKFL
jgi:hypothetical protein